MSWLSDLYKKLTSRASSQASKQSSRRDKTQTKTSSTSTKTKTNSGRPSSSKSGGSSKGGSTTSRPSYTSPRSGGSTYRRPSTATSRGTVGKSRVGQARRTGSTTTRPKTTVTKALTTSERQSGSTAEEKQKKGMALTVAERTELQNNKPAGTAITKGTVLTQKQRKEAQNRRPKKTAKELTKEVANNPKYFKDGKYQINAEGGKVKTDTLKYGEHKEKKKVYQGGASTTPRSERRLYVDDKDKAPDFVDFNPMGQTALNHGIAKHQAEKAVKQQTKKIDKQVKKLEEQGYTIDREYVKELKGDIKKSKKKIEKQAFEGLEKNRIANTAKAKAQHNIENQYKPKDYGKLKSEQLTSEDYLKLQNASRLGGKLGNKALGKDLAEKVGSRTAYSAGKNTISKVTTGAMQGLAYGDVLHGGVGTYNKDAKKVLKEVKESGAYNLGYAGGQMAGFALSGTNSLGKSAATTGLRASAKAIAKAEARNAGQQFMRNRAAEMAIETPMNLLDAVKMSRDENGKVDKKQLAMYMSLNTALTGVAGGAMEGIGMAMTRAEGKTYADLLAKSKAGTLTTEGKAQLEKLQNKLVRATEDLYSPKASIANDALGLKTLDKNENKDLIRLTYKGDTSKLTEQESKRLKEITDKSAALEKQNDAIRADLKKSVEIKAQTLNKLSKETGVEYVYTNNDEIVKALRESGKTVEDDVFVNGVTLTKDGKRKIYINSDSDQAHNIIVGHETTHLLSGTEHFDALKNSVKEYAENLGDYEALRKTFEDVYDSEVKSMSKEEADAFIDEEVTAELVGRYLFGENGEDFVRQLSMKDKNVFQRMYDYIVNAIRNASGDAELRQLNAIKENFDKAYKELGETPESLRAKTDGADFSLGYHAGDLGKSEPRSQMSGDRGTGHFGTGTYFVGNKAKISDDYYGKRPVESVDFDKYKLWKPLIDSDAGELHDFLRSVNRYWDKADSKFQTMDDIFKARREGKKIYDEFFDARRKEGKDWWEEPSQDTLNKYGEKYRKFFEDTGTERVYDDIVNDYRAGREFDGNYTAYMIDEMQSQIEDMDSDWYRSLDSIRKSIGDEYSQLAWAERLFDGVSAKDIKKALREVAEEMRLDKTPENVQDSASTRLMKKLGYEGVDVRGTSYDNTQYGSVIYDLKGEDLARKQEIGTARFSKSKTLSVDDNVPMRELDRSGSTLEKDGNPVATFDKSGSVRFSLSSYNDSGRAELKKYLDNLVGKKEMSRKEADQMSGEIEKIYEVCRKYADSGEYVPFSTWSSAKVVTDESGRPVFSSVKKNAEYEMNLDFSTVCKKRRTLDAVFNEMVARGIIDNMNLNADQSAQLVVKINDVVREHGFEAACSVCFVEARRYRQQGTAQKFASMYNDLVKSMYKDESKISYFNYGGDKTIADIPDGIHSMDDADLDLSHLQEVSKQGNTAEARAARLLLNDPSQRKLLRVGDMMGSTGFENMQINNPKLMKIYNAKKGTGGAKSSFGDVQYLNEIVKSKSFNRDKAYSVGGVRVQSFSDYVPRMVFDYVQMVGDLSAKRLPVHTYTKEPMFAKQFGLTGMKINMSLVPDAVEDGVAPGLDKFGNYIWNKDGTFPFDEAMRLQEAPGYKENCGTIAIGVSDEQIRKMLADPKIQMVIPYHKSSLNSAIADMTNVGSFKDYTSVQTTKGADGKSLSEKKDFPWNDELHKLSHNENGELKPRSEWGDPQDIVKKYADWCEENGYTPKFPEFLHNEDGTINRGYYKLLEDFSLYDNDGNFKPQHDVQAKFPTDEDSFGSMASLIKDGLEEDAILEGKRTNDISGIVDEVVAGVKDEGWVDGDMRFSIVKKVTDTDGNTHENVVKLDTDLFKAGEPKAEKAAKLHNFVYDNFAGRRFTAYDDAGNPIDIEFARVGEKHKKISAKRSQKTLDEIADKPSYGERRFKTQKAAAQADELIEVSRYSGESANNVHGKLDKNGWEYRTLKVMDDEGNLNNCVLSIAKTEDGRNLLYDIKIKEKIGQVSKAADSDLPESPIFKDRLAEDADDVKYSKSKRQKKKDAKRAEEYSPEKAADIEGLEAAKSAKASAEEKLTSLKSARDAEAQAGEKLANRQRNVSKFGKQEGKAERLNEIKAKKAESDSKLAQLDKDIESATKELDKARASIDSYAKNESVKPIGRKEKTAAKVDRLKSEIDGFNTEIKDIRKAITAKNAEIRRLDKVDYGKMSQKEMDAHLAKRNKVVQEVNDMRQNITDLRSRIESRQKEIGETGLLKAQKDALNKPVTPAKRAEAKRAQKQALKEAERKDAIKRGIDVEAYEDAKVPYTDVTTLSDKQIERELNNIKFANKNAKTPAHTEIRNQRKAELVAEKARRKEEGPRYAALRDDQLSDTDPGWTIKRDEEVRRPAGMSTPADAPTAQTPKPTADGNAPKAPKVKPKTGIRAAIDNKTASFRRLFVSSLTGFEDTARSLKDQTMRRELNNAITSVQQINNRVSAFVEKGRTSFDRKQTGISLNEIFDKHHLFKKENQAKLTDFTNYLTYKHAIDRLDVGKPVHLGDNGLSLYTKEDYREMMDAITRDMSDETRKQLDEFETDVRGYFNDLQQYRVDSGQITPEFREYLDKTYPNYVPTYREGDEFLQSELIKSKSKKASVKQSVNVATGGQGEIQDLWSQMVSITHNTIAAGEENNLINVYCKAKGIPTDLVPKDITLDDAMETAIGVKEVGHGQYRVEFFTNGKPTSVVVDKQIAKGLREINGQEFARLMDAMSHTSGAMRAFKGPITDYNLIFGVKNVGRDTQQAVVNSKDTFWYTKSVPSALSSIANKDSVMRKLYEMNGGYHSSMVLSGKNISMPGSKGGVKGAAKTAFDNTLGRIEEVNNLFEMGPRMCEFIGTLSKHADEQLKANGSSLKQLRNEIEKEMFPHGVKSNEGLAQVEEEFMKRIADMADKDVIDAAARNAADITLNFSRNGVVTKALNMGAVPYMNPAIQGISKTARMFTESNAEGILIPFLAKLGTITALPAVANEYLCAGNRDYQNLNARDKDANFFIPLGDGRFIKLPKPRENAALVLPIEYGMRWMLEKASIGEVELPAVGKPAIEQGEYGKWKDLGQMFTSGLDLMGPANPLTENIYSPITRLWKNETWYGGAIESTSEVLRKKDGELKNSEIMDESTSALAKWIGQKKIGNTTVSDLTHLSPKKIDNLMDSYLGVIYDMGISQTADAKHGNPILNQFVTDSLFSNKNGTELWAEFDKANAPKDTKGKAIQKGKDIVFGHNQYNINEKSQEAKDWLNLKGYDDITYSDALNKILYDKKLTDAERKKYQRVIKKAQNDLRHELVYGAKEVKPGMDPIRTIAKLFGVNKAMNKFTYTYTDPETGEKINKHLDAWKAYKQTEEYKKDKAKGGEKFIDFYTKMRWTNGRIGESKAYPSWMTAAVIAATEKGNNKALAGSYIKPPWDKDGTYAQSIIDRGENYKDAGYNQGKYRRSQKAIFNAGRKLGYDYTNQMNPWDKAMALSTNKKHDFSDGAYYAADTSGKVSRRMNYARCLDAKGYTTKQIYKFAKEYDIKLPKTDNMSKEQYVTTMKAFNAKVERAVKDKYGDRPLEEQAAVYHVITDDLYNKPFGDVGDYGKKKDTGITDLDKKPSYGGWGYGGGYGGHGWGGGGWGGWGGGSGGASSGVGAVFGKPKVTDAKAPKSSGSVPKGSISKAKTTKIKMADFSKMSVGDYRTPSNLNDAYRKKAQKLREASRTRKK